MHLLVLLLSLSLVQSQNHNSTQQDAVKSKRGITLLPTGAIIGGPNYKPSIFYPDTAPSASANLYSNPKALYTIQQSTQIKPVLIPETSKPFIYDQYPPHDQLETQPNLSETTQHHVIYNHQQYPPQRLHRLTNNPTNLQPQPNQYHHSAQTIVNPIQHSSYIHHTPYTIPGGSPQARYYSAGKMLYHNQNHQPSQFKPQPTNAVSYQRVQFPQKAPIQYHYQQQQNHHPNLNNITPIQFGHQQTHHGHHMPESQKEDVEDEYDEEKHLEQQQEAEEDENDGVEEKEELREDEEETQDAEEEDERPAEYRNNDEQEHEEDEEERNPFSKYQALDVPEYERYEEEAAEEDEDSDKSSSYDVPKNKKSQKYYSKTPKYDFYDRFHYKPSIKRIIKTEPVKPAKKYSTKIESKFGGHKSNNKLNQDKLDNNSKQSQKVPIAVHKFYKEKWYLAKEDIK